MVVEVNERESDRQLHDDDDLCDECDECDDDDDDDDDDNDNDDSDDSSHKLMMPE